MGIFPIRDLKVKLIKIKKMECKFCKNTFSNKQNLNSHQRTAKYCLRIQGKEAQYIHECKKCEKKFSSKKDLKRHMLSCKSNSKKKILEDKKIIEELKIRVNTLETENKILHIEKILINYLLQLSKDLVLPVIKQFRLIPFGIRIMMVLFRQQKRIAREPEL
jgi:hypothetical protein